MASNSAMTDRQAAAFDRLLDAVAHELVCRYLEELDAAPSQINAEGEAE